LSETQAHLDPLERPQRLWPVVLTIVVVAVLMHAPGLFAGRLSGTEGHRAITAHQMLRDGNWITPFLFDQPYLRKPPLMYWTIAFSERVFGASEWAWRLPSLASHVLMCVLVVLFTGRWFGVRSAWWAGAAVLGTVPLWESARSADIDALNTLVSLACGLSVIQLSMQKHVGWMLSIAVLFGLSLLAKGPAGLPVILGAVLGVVVVKRNLVRAGGNEGSTKVLLKSLGIALAIGLLIFIVWIVALWVASRVSQYPTDTSGAAEGAGNIVKLFREPSRLASMIMLPMVLLAFALPWSLGLAAPTMLHLDVTQTRVAQIVWQAFVFGCLICVVSGMTNVRYAYILLPLLPILFGAVMAAGAAPSHRGVAMTVGVFVLAAVISIPFHGALRTQRSAYSSAKDLRDLVSEGEKVMARRMILSTPELFYYAGVEVVSPGQRPITPAFVVPGMIMVLYEGGRNREEDEYTTLSKHFGDRLRVIRQLQIHKRVVFVCVVDRDSDRRSTSIDQSSSSSQAATSLSSAGESIVPADDALLNRGAR